MGEHMRTAPTEFVELTIKIPIVLDTVRDVDGQKNFPVKVDCSITSEERRALHGLYEGLRAMNVDLVSGTYIRPVASFADCVRSLLRTIYDQALAAEVVQGDGIAKPKPTKGSKTPDDVATDEPDPPPIRKGK